MRSTPIQRIATQPPSGMEDDCNYLVVRRLVGDVEVDSQDIMRVDFKRLVNAFVALFDNDPLGTIQVCVLELEHGAEMGGPTREVPNSRGSVFRRPSY
jgi:hypothetical protein